MEIRRNHTGHRVGESHQRAKLSDADVREMRAAYAQWQAEGKRKGYETAAAIWKCGVSTARDIITYRTRVSA